MVLNGEVTDLCFEQKKPTGMRKLFLFVVLSSTISYVSAQATKPKPGAKMAAPTTAPALSAPAEDKEMKAEFVNRMFTEKSYLYAQIVDKLFTFKLSPSCWAMYSSPTAPPGKSSSFMGLQSAASLANYAVTYAKRENIGDFMALAVDDKAVEKANRPMIDEMIKQMREKFSLVVEAPVECKGLAYEMLLRYPEQVMSRLGYDGTEWSPAGGEAHFTTMLSTTAKDMTIKVSPDGKQYTVTGPAYVEAYDTQSKISKGLDRTNKNR